MQLQSSGSTLKKVTAVIGLIVAGAFWWRIAATTSVSSAPTSQSEALSSNIIQHLKPSQIRYVAVEDSYTYGEGADQPHRQCWPVLLTRDLQANGINIGLAANTGVNGWTSEDAIRSEIPIYRQAKPQFATLMIGVNDTYRPIGVEQFRNNLHTLITQMKASLPKKTDLIVITIPDYTATPVGKGYGSMNGGGQKVAFFNAVIKDEARKTGVQLVDVYPLTVQMGADRSLVAMDGLHPSAKEYALWEKRVFPVAVRLLRQK